jgi:hypothetical protein
MVIVMVLGVGLHCGLWAIAGGIILLLLLLLHCFLLFALLRCFVVAACGDGWHEARATMFWREMEELCGKIRFLTRGIKFGGRNDGRTDGRTTTTTTYDRRR